MPAKYLIVLSERHTLSVHRYVILRLRFQFRKSQIPILWFQVHSYPYLNVIQPQLNIYSLYFHSIFLKTFFQRIQRLYMPKHQKQMSSGINLTSLEQLL